MLDDGGEDQATGLGDDDGFYFGAELSAGDLVDGGAGTNDQPILTGMNPFHPGRRLLFWRREWPAANQPIFMV